MRGSLAAAGAALATAGVAWGLFEAQWVRFRRIHVAIRGLPPSLDGFTALHLSDLHLGMPALNARALLKAVEWARPLEPDIVALTGDLLSRQRGEACLHEAVGRLDPRHGIYAVLGNHDIDASRDPFSRATVVGGLEERGVLLLRDSSHSVRVNGLHVQIVGCAPSRHAVPPPPIADPGADLRILLAHFPDVVELTAAGEYHLVLAGHMHGGQICLPGPRGKIRLLNPSYRYPEGLFQIEGATLHVSRGLGTSLVPLRFLARPEATLLTLRAA